MASKPLLPLFLLKALRELAFAVASGLNFKRQIRMRHLLFGITNIHKQSVSAWRHWTRSIVSALADSTRSGRVVESLRGRRRSLSLGSPPSQPIQSIIVRYLYHPLRPKLDSRHRLKQHTLRSGLIIQKDRQYTAPDSSAIVRPKLLRGIHRSVISPFNVNMPYQVGVLSCF